MQPAATGADDLLLARFRAGDETAFATIFDGWSGAVHRLATRILGDEAEADDIVEETFWQAWRSRESFDPRRGHLTAWLLTIARSRALDRLRAAGRRPETSDDSAIARAPSAAPADGAEVEEQSRLVNDALSRLPDEQREVIMLGYFEGLSQTEIAARTGHPLGTVKTRVRLAMTKLRDQLSPLRSNR